MIGCCLFGKEREGEGRRGGRRRRRRRKRRRKERKKRKKRRHKTQLTTKRLSIPIQLNSIPVHLLLSPPPPPPHPSSPTPLTPQPKQIAIATFCTTTIHPSHLCPSLPFPSRPLSIQSLATFQQFRTQSPDSKPHGSSDFNDRRDLKIGSSAKVCKIWGWG